MNKARSKTLSALAFNGVRCAVVSPMILLCACDPLEESSETTASQFVEKSAAPIFVDRARELGVDFVHFNGMSGEYSIVEEMAPGGALFDFDGDGDLDLYLIQGRVLGEGKTVGDAILEPRHPLPLSDRLYRNDLMETGNLSFSDITEESGLEARGYGLGVAVGDYDNDGHPDLYVTNYGSNQLLRGVGDGTFEDVTTEAGVDDERMSLPAVFFDGDRDGWLDLYVGNYVHYPADNPPRCYDLTGAPDYCGPDVFRPEGDRFFRNLGRGADGKVTFEDATASSGLAKARAPALGAVPADFNGDGWLDLYVANDSQPNHLWINRRGAGFSDEALLAGCAVNAEGQAEGSMGVNAADFDGDGDLDLFVTHFATESNTLYAGDGQGLFTDVTESSGLGPPSQMYTAFGTVALDFDNDGWLDLLVANGAVNKIEALARQGDPFPLHQTNQLFRNLGGGRFWEVTAEAGAVFELSEVSRGVIGGDLDNDGDVDAVVANNSGPARVLINRAGQDRYWLGLRWVDTRGVKNPPGVRAAVLRDGQPTLWRRSRTAASYASAQDPRILFGLGENPDVSRVRVVWPDASIEEWSGIQAGRYTTLRQGTGDPAGQESVGATPTSPGSLVSFGSPVGATPASPGSPGAPVRATTVGATPASPGSTESNQIQAIPEPDLAVAEPQVREQIAGQLAMVNALTSDSKASAVVRAEAFGDLGLLYLAYQFQDAAEVCLSNARFLAPDDYRWSYLSAYLFEIQGHLRPAAELFERAVMLEPDRLPGLLRLARVQLRLGQTQRARLLFERALTLDPSSAAADQGLGKIAVSVGDPAAAVKHFTQALRHAPEASSLHYLLAQAYRDLGDLEKAQAHLRQRGEIAVAVSDPLLEPLTSLGSGVHFYLSQGATALNDGDYQTAASIFRRALALDSESFTAYRGLSYAVEHLGDLEGAIAHLERALISATTRDVEKDRRERAEVHRLLGGLTALAMRDNEAIRHFEHSIELSPTQGDVRRKLANALSRSGRFEDALPHWGWLIETHPEHAAQFYLSRATVLVNLRRADDAIADFEQAIVGTPDDAPLRLRYAAALDFLGRDGAAEQRSIAARMSGDPEVRASLLATEARQHLAGGRLEDAVQKFREALALDALLHAARYELASALNGLGRFDQALFEFRTVIEAEPRHAAARRGEIVALLSIDRYGETRIRLQEALRLFPRDVRLAHALARLLATAPDRRVRDGALAQEIAERLAAAHDDPRIRETLAMAFAETGDFERAIEIQRGVVAASGPYSQSKGVLREFEKGKAWTASGAEMVAAIAGLK